MSPVDGNIKADPIDRLIINLRAYVQARPKSDWRPFRALPSDVVLIFDTETKIDPSQRLEFGAYQLRIGGELRERGLFYADDLESADLATLRQTFDTLEPGPGESLKLRTLAQFVDEVFFAWGLDAGGQIVGFNLPFDLSRIAIKHTYAKGAMKGGFSFVLAEHRPNVRVKHLSQRAAFIDFGGEDANDSSPDRGYFVDVKTLAAALTSQSHSLKSLTKLLGVTLKEPLESYAGPLTAEKVLYCLTDVQATWECFAELSTRYAKYGLKAGLYELYSEASLGKAFLQGMNIKPWLSIQGKFPPAIIGKIMSAYYGGRAEVHLRREITPVIHCDFLSMYPTVCTLMGLWRFVVASRMRHEDATDEVRRLVNECSLADLQDPALWRRLNCLVQINPSGDIMPVRAVYEREQSATIGLNSLTAKEPMWFTLADVLAAKILGGKSPDIVSAIKFEAEAPQAKLRSIELEGVTVRPARDDFYKLLIDQRRRIQKAEDVASGEEKAALKSAQKSMKILANSTSYGIFVELNVQDLDRPTSATCFDFRGVGRKIPVSKVEDPGRYFHPLLGTLITGAARLMLALAERGALDQGLDWAFCDTDSLAIANPAGLDRPEFIRRVEAVRAWFEPLNPYEVKGSILQLEKVNYPPERDGDPAALRPINCLAISAKRYVLFDRDADGRPTIRKASAHGLGHLVAPYPDPDKSDRIGRIAVELWQEDLWLEIINAFDAGRPDQPDFASLRNFAQPAASRYAATNRTLLTWFDRYNDVVGPRASVWPFNFLLSFQPKSGPEMAASDPDALWTAAWRRRRPNPASRYSSDLLADQPETFDRQTGQPVPWHWLKSVGRSLVRHHLHSEMKFLGGEGSQRGPLRRRNVHAWAMIPIGKEADNLEEREFLGDDDDAIEWSLARQDRHQLLQDMEEALRTYQISDARLIQSAGVSHHTLATLRRGGPASAQSLLSLARAAEELRHQSTKELARADGWRRMGMKLKAIAGGRNRLADRLGLSRPYVGRVLSGEKPMTPEVIERLKAFADQVGVVAGDTNDILESSLG